MAPTAAFLSHHPSLGGEFPRSYTGHFYFSVQDQGTTGGVLAAAKYLTQLCFQGLSRHPLAACAGTGTLETHKGQVSTRHVS